MQTSWWNIWKITLYYFAKHSSQPFFSTFPSKNTGTPSAFGCIFGFLIYKLWHSQLPDNNIVSQERMVGYLLSIWWSVSVMYSYEWHNLQKVWDEWCFWLRTSVYCIYTELTLLIFHFIPPFCTYNSTNIKCACLNLRWPAHILTHMLRVCC